MERRLAAILAADVVSYSTLMENDEAGTLSSLSDIIAQLVEPLVAENNGRIFKLIGDGVLADFGSVVDAVTCAIAWQKRMEEDKSGLQFRIGINLGDIIAQDGDIFGNGVNVASRLEGLAPDNGVLIGEATYQQIADSIEVKVLDPLQVKNRAEPVQPYLVVSAAKDSID